jgi:hypothetical protein
MMAKFHLSHIEAWVFFYYNRVKDLTCQLFSKFDSNIPFFSWVAPFYLTSESQKIEKFFTGFILILFNSL